MYGTELGLNSGGGNKKLIDGDKELFHLWYFVWRPLHAMKKYGKVEVDL